jgi:hypothetical protein
MRVILLIVSTLIYFVSIGQKSLKFTEQVTFAYQSEEKTKEFSVFVEPKTGTWLLTKDDTFGGSVDDIDQWILKPNGQIILIGTEHNGKRQKIKYQNNAFKFSTVSMKAKPTGKTKTFGQNTSGWQTLKGTEYTATIGKSQAKFYASLMPYNCRALLAYNACVEIENHLSGFGSTEYYKILSSKYLLLQDNKLNIVSIAPTEYWVEM